MDKRLLAAVWILVIVAFAASLLVLSAVEHHQRVQREKQEADRQATHQVLYITYTAVHLMIGTGTDPCKCWTNTPSPTPAIALTATSGK
jgi:hypothetical protein